MQKHSVVAADMSQFWTNLSQKAVSSDLCSCVRVVLLSVEELLSQADCKMTVNKVFCLTEISCLIPVIFQI